MQVVLHRMTAFFDVMHQSALFSAVHVRCIHQKYLNLTVNQSVNKTGRLGDDIIYIKQ